MVFNPLKIRLHEKNCNKDQNTCFNIEYCVSYNGKHIRKKQSALITLEITDSKLTVKEIRAKIKNAKNSDQKTIELSANENKCFKNNDSFEVMVNVSLILVLY